VKEVKKNCGSIFPNTLPCKEIQTGPTLQMTDSDVMTLSAQ